MVTRQDIQATCDDKEPLTLIVPTIPVWRTWRTDLSTLSRHAVDFRYPGKSATANDVAHAMHICNKVREAVRAQLNPDRLHAHS